MTESGLLLVDKPADWTSHDVVAKLRGILSTRRVGHAGTLDPMATGLLVIGVNAGTKLLTFLVGADKTYLATIRLGQATNTDDAEGEPLGELVDATSLSEDQIRTQILKLTGSIQQVPSSVSAIKVDGKRAYALVRGGEQVKLAARPVTIARFDLVAEPRKSPEGFVDLDVVIDCSSGTYVRALARDLGAALGTGGHLTALRRTRIGEYSVDSAVSLEGAHPDSVTELSRAASGAFATRVLSDAEATDLRHGKRILAAGIPGDYAALDAEGNLVAMLREVQNQAKSSVVFANV
jgi:tRNA pseudouridine55 synthase